MGQEKPLTEAQKQALRRKRAQQAPTPSSPPVAQNQAQSQNRSRSVATLVFLGSLLGTLIGTFASLNDLSESFSLLGNFFNPPTVMCVAGSGTILGEGLGMAATWEENYEIRNPEIDLQVNATGSVDGVRLAAEGGCVDVLAMSEALTADQLTLLNDNGVDVECAVEIGYDIIAFVTDSNNSLPALLERLMGNVLTGRYTNWDQVRGNDQTIYIYARPGSGTTDYVLRQFGWQLGERQLPPNANYIECDSNSDCLDLTLSTPGSLYWVSTSWMRTQPSQYLRVLPILRGDERPINPLRDDFDIREYPGSLVRPLYMYVLGNSNTDEATRDRGRNFLRYVRGVDGQQILEDNYFYTHFNQPEGVELDFPEGFPTEVDGPRVLCRR